MVRGEPIRTDLYRVDPTRPLTPPRPTALFLRSTLLAVISPTSPEAAFERAARLADGFIFFGTGGIDHAVSAWRRLRDRLDGLGRPVEDFGADYVALPQGGVGDLPAQVDAWREAGGTHVSVATMGIGLDSAERHIDYLASVADTLSLSCR